MNPIENTFIKAGMQKQTLYWEKLAENVQEYGNRFILKLFKTKHTSIENRLKNVRANGSPYNF